MGAIAAAIVFHAIVTIVGLMGIRDAMRDARRDRLLHEATP